MRRARLGAVLALAAATAGLGGGPAGGHGGDHLARPVLESVEPKAAEGLQVDIPFTANYQFLVTNPTGVELTVLADTGEPFIRIGPDGVFGNFKSKAWYDSTAPEGLLRFPDHVEDGPDAEPIWRKVSVEPSWGWFDHRLHPEERFVGRDVLESVEPVPLGRWEVPISFGGERGRLQGRFEYRPTLGMYRSRLRSSEQLADGIRVQVVSAQTVPALYLENHSAETVLVLGRANEPFIRIGPHVEYNLYSPSYVELQQARGETPPRPADAAHEPEWQEVQTSPRWSWLEFRAAPPSQDPPGEAARRATPTVVRSWKVPLLIGDRKTEIAGVTEFVPIAQVQDAAGRVSGGGAGRTPVLLGVMAVTGAAGYLVFKPKKKR